MVMLTLSTAKALSVTYGDFSAIFTDEPSRLNFFYKLGVRYKHIYIIKNKYYLYFVKNYPGIVRVAIKGSMQQSKTCR